MSEAEEAGAAARLEELAAVTKEYAQYAHALSGLGASAAGAWFVALFVVAIRSDAWGRVAGLWTPFVVLAVLLLAKRHYQRFGYVSAPASPSRSTRLALVRELGPAFTAGAAILSVATQHERWSRGDHLLSLGAAAAVAAVPFAFVMRARVRAGDLDEIFARLSDLQVLAIVILASPFESMIVKGWLALMAVYGVAMFPIGVREHLRYRRLERRLAALREAR